MDAVYDDEGAVDWPTSLRRLASRLTMDPRAGAPLITMAEDVYAQAISAKAWDGVPDTVYNDWAFLWYGILDALSDGAVILWD